MSTAGTYEQIPAANLRTDDFVILPTWGRAFRLATVDVRDDRTGRVELRDGGGTLFVVEGLERILVLDPAPRAPLYTGPLYYDQNSH